MAALLETIESILSSSTNSVYTTDELNAMSYQLQGSYDNKPVEILSKDLYHIKPFAASANMSFFDSQVQDNTVSNIIGGALPAGESHTAHELLIRFTPISTTTPSDVISLMNAAQQAIANSYITVGVQNKTPWIQLQGARLFAGLSGFQNVVEAAANTVPVAVGNPSVVDLRYVLSIPKVIGEKVSFSANILWNTPILAANILVTSGSKLSIHLAGINIRGR